MNERRGTAALLAVAALALGSLGCSSGDGDDDGATTSTAGDTAETEELTSYDDIDALHQALVDQGWIVFSLDNRGTPRRGTKFENAVYRAMGAAEVEDQLAGLAWLKQQDFVDPKRIASMGWSYGGYMTLKLLEKAPGAFAAGVAVAPVTKWELYDTAYTERYLGNPRLDPKPYQSSDVLPYTSRISDPLLIIHGTADDNVYFMHSLKMTEALFRAGKQFDFLPLAGFTHMVPDPEVTVRLESRIVTFFKEHLGEPR